jgi:hypothetical protein
MNTVPIRERAHCAPSQIQTSHGDGVIELRIFSTRQWWRFPHYITEISTTQDSETRLTRTSTLYGDAS